MSKLQAVMDSVKALERRFDAITSRDDADLKAGEEKHYKNHIIRATGSPRGMEYTVFGPPRRQGGGNPFIITVGTFEGAKREIEKLGQ